MIGELLTVEEIAQKLGASVRWIQERIRDGSIRHFRDGNIIRISDADFKEYLARCSTVVEAQKSSRPKRSSDGVIDYMVKDALRKKR